MKKLTIAMAAYEDFPGVWQTVESLRMYHKEKYDILVLDNAKTPCKQTRGVTLATDGQYVYRPDLNGTSASRDQLMYIAKTPWVMVVDCHIMLELGAIAAALDHIEKNSESNDMIQGPLVSDNGRGYSTHWRETTRPGLWGVWDRALVNEKTGAVYLDSREVNASKLLNEGWVFGEQASKPFEIRSQGLGLYMMRKEAWPGFNPSFQGFGGEEGYIHEKVRQRGGRVLCHPKLQWRHRFRDMKGGGQPPPYPHIKEHHAWNLLVGHRELGIAADEVIKKDFGGGIQSPMWSKLVQMADNSQPIGEHKSRNPKTRILGIWYSNNKTHDRILKGSLESIRKAKESSRHHVEIVTCPWQSIKGFPFHETIATYTKGPGHLNIARQMHQAILHGLSLGEFDAVAFLEHDVLYGPDYFDRIGEAFDKLPEKQVVSNLDYIGLNETGFLKVKERHEPMHQLSMRMDYALTNVERAVNEAAEKGSCLVEPDSGTDRSNWVRLNPRGNVVGAAPCVHINYKGRFTSHGEVVYEKTSSIEKKEHPYWGDYKHIWPDQTEGCGGCGASKVPTLPEFTDMDEWLKLATEQSSDFNEHINTVRGLADKCDNVAEISIWLGKSTTVALGSSKAKRFTSYGPVSRPSYKQMRRFRQDGSGFNHISSSIDGSLKPDLFEQTDLLLIDTLHRASALTPLLNDLHTKVNKYLVIHCTETFGETGDDKQLGVLHAIRKFISEHTEWRVLRYDKNNNGLMVLSKAEEDKLELPSLPSQALSFLKAKAVHWLNNRKYLPLQMAEERLKECWVCPLRQDNRCSKCGCYLNVVSDDAPTGAGSPGRAFYPDRGCPIGKWGTIDPKSIPDSAYQEEVVVPGEEV